MKEESNFLLLHIANVSKYMYVFCRVYVLGVGRSNTTYTQTRTYTYSRTVTYRDV